MKIFQTPNRLMQFLRVTRRPLLCMFLILHLFMENYAQGIQVGEKSPDVPISSPINLEFKATRLSDLWQKPTILDFWATTCSACLQSFPKTDSLAKRFAGKVNFILVTYQDREKGLSIFSTIKRLNGIRLPMIFSDTLLRLLFPYRGLPHVVWLGKGGVVQAITLAKHVTEENLNAFALGKPLSLPTKKTDEEYTMESILAAINPTESMKHISKYTYLSSKREEIPEGKLSVHRRKGFVRIHGANLNVFTLYKVALGKFQDHEFGFSRIFFQDSAGILRSVLGSPKTQYCYDLQMRDTAFKQAFEIMQRDLDRETGWISSLEKRKITCAILRLTSNVDKLRGDYQGRADGYKEGGNFIFRNIPLANVIRSTFNVNPTFPYPLINETGYSGRVNIILPLDLGNIPAVQAALARYDLSLTLEEREMEVIILRKN